MLFLLTDDDIAVWAAQDEPELLKAQECAFDYDTRTLAAIDEQVHKEVTDQTRVDTAPRWWTRVKQKVESPGIWGAFFLAVVIFVNIFIFFFAPIWLARS